MDPRAWVEFPFPPSQISTESGQVKIQRVLNQKLPATLHSVVPVFFGTIVAGVVGGIDIRPGVVDGEVTPSLSYPGFVLGLNIDTSENTDLSGILLSCNFSDSPFSLRRVSVNSIVSRTTGQKFLRLDFPTRKESSFFWKLENFGIISQKVKFTLVYQEVRR